MKHFNYTFSCLLAASALFFLSSPVVFSQFNPGEGGPLPTFPTFTIADGKIGGLSFHNTQRTNGSFAGSGSRSLVEMYFPEPTTIGADSSLLISYSIT